MSDDLTPSRIQPTQLDTTRAQAAAAAQQAARGMVVAQEESEEGFQSWIDEGAFNPTVMARRFEALENKRKRTARDEEAEKTERKEQVLQVQRLDEVSEQFSRRNPELQTRSLLLLRARINQNDTREEVLRKVLEMYPDYSLADDFMHRPSPVDDGPASRQKLNRKVAAILDPNMIRPEPAVGGRVGLLRKKAYRHANCNSASDRYIWEKHRERVYRHDNQPRRDHRRGATGGRAFRAPRQWMTIGRSGCRAA